MRTSNGYKFVSTLPPTLATTLATTLANPLETSLETPLESTRETVFYLSHTPNRIESIQSYKIVK